MTESSGPTDSPKDLVTAAEHIQTLSRIGESIPQLLHSAGSAVSLLTPSPPDSASPPPENEDLRKDLFLGHVRKYFTTLREVQETLLKQTAALEDAGIIPVDVPKTGVASTGSGMAAMGGSIGSGGATKAEGEVTNGGLGKMEVSWLNSRAKDVGWEKEREVVKQAREWLEHQANGEDIKDEVMGDG